MDTSPPLRTNRRPIEVNSLIAAKQQRHENGTSFSPNRPVVRIVKVVGSKENFVLCFLHSKVPFSHESLAQKNRYSVVELNDI